MPKITECPKCGEDISHTYEGYDPSVGIMSAGWYCEACDLPVIDDEEPYDEPDYDAKPFRETYLEAWNEHQKAHRR
jgi:hypothetical protein